MVAYLNHSIIRTLAVLREKNKVNLTRLLVESVDWQRVGRPGLWYTGHTDRDTFVT